MQVKFALRAFVFLSGYMDWYNYSFHIPFDE